MSRTGEIRERAAKATPGPWTTDCWNRGAYIVGNVRGGRPGGEVIGELDSTVGGLAGYTTADKHANAAFIAAARSDIPFLLEQLSKAEQLIAGIREAAASADQFHRRLTTITRLLAGYQATGGSE